MRQWSFVDEQLQHWLDLDDEDDTEDDEDEDGLQGWTQQLVRPEESMALYKSFLAFDSKHLPWRGGLLDQEDWWIHDVTILAARRGFLRKKHKRDRSARERVDKLRRQLEARKARGKGK